MFAFFKQLLLESILMVSRLLVMKNVSIFSARSNCPGNRCHLFDTPPNSCETTVVTVADEDMAAAASCDVLNGAGD